jgi:DNA-binding Lrp family transcriptional regulator
MMMAAFVFLQIGVSGGYTDIRTLHDALHAISGVKTVHILAGPTDAVVFVEAADQAELMRTVGEIRGTSGVEKTDTRIVLPI